MNTFTATESYLSLLLSLPHLQPMTVLSVFFLTIGRILPIVTLAPFLGSRNVAAPIRIMFSLSLVAIFLPANLLAMKRELTFSLPFIGYLIKEVLVGFILGFLSMVPFMIAQMAGSLIDFQRGAASLQVSDPTTRTQTGPVGLLFNFVLIALFFSLDGPFLYLNGLADAYQLIPIDALVQPSWFDIKTPFWAQMFSLASTMMTIATQLAAPALIGVLLTDLFLGIANRLAPQVQIVFLGIALKSWVGLALMTAAWVLIVRVMGEQTMQWFQILQTLVRQIGQSIQT